MANVLGRYAFKRVELVQADDPNTTLPVDISGFEVLGVITPGVLDGSSNNITPQIDPGNGTFYTPLTNSGGAITWWAAVAANEWLQVPQSIAPLVGARLRFQLAEDEDADRVFLLILVPINE